MRRLATVLCMRQRRAQALIGKAVDGAAAAMLTKAGMTIGGAWPVLSCRACGPHHGSSHHTALASSQSSASA
ncbi:MAG TPA: hypothetical protein VL614_13170, partial [Acetobacteraceae bacterium]|nr:hypothetical protein [Acetobacteraceae bacterium]